MFTLSFIVLVIFLVFLSTSLSLNPLSNMGDLWIVHFGIWVYVFVFVFFFCNVMRQPRKCTNGTLT